MTPNNSDQAKNAPRASQSSELLVMLLHHNHMPAF